MRKVCFLTGSRSDYGILSGLMNEISITKCLKLQIIVTGAHLSKNYGMTINEIQNDGFKINSKVNILPQSSFNEDMVSVTANGLKKISHSLQKLKPDILIILGDRYEAFAGAFAALCLRIPIAHIHGGEKTEGSIDEAMRHSITKMSLVHFTATKEAYKRVLQLGENKKNVFYTGSLAAEKIKKMSFYKKHEIENLLRIKFQKKNIVVTYHVETTKIEKSHKDFINLLSVLSNLKGTMIIFTMPNADTGNKKINNEIISFVKKNKKNSCYFNSLGQKLYFSILKTIDVCIGNSSSGIIEVPLFNKVTINIGTRQKGREQSTSIINCSGKKNDIKSAIKKSFSFKFKEKIKKKNSNIYKSKNTSKIITRVIKKINLNKQDSSKIFNDLSFS